MGLRRYSRSNILGLGQRYGTSYAIPIIRENIRNGNIRYDEYILDVGERLDTLAGRFYGDGRNAWIIAAASDIGWCLAAPPGTLLRIPNLNDVAQYVG